MCHAAIAGILHHHPAGDRTVYAVFHQGVFYEPVRERESTVRIGSVGDEETLGSILGPLVLGGLQSYFSRDTGIFFVAAGFSIAVFLSLLVGSFPSDMTVSAFP
jgi:hypothetical protein